MKRNVILMVLLLFLFAGCGQTVSSSETVPESPVSEITESSIEPAPENPESVEEDTFEQEDNFYDDGKNEFTKEIVVDVPGKLDRVYKYYILNDTHLFVPDDEIKDEYKDLVTNRIAEYSLDGVPSSECFEDWIKKLDTKHLDGVILNGDIIDQLSLANLNHVKKCMDKVDIPWMYLQSDHDRAQDWVEVSEEDYSKITELQEEMDLNRGVYIWEEDEFIILGINKPWESISWWTLNEIKAVWNLGKPIILFSHVPYDSSVSNELAEKSAELKNGDILLWGWGTRYLPDSNMEEFMYMLYDSDSPVVAIISAHLHIDYEGTLNGTIPIYVIDTGYGGTRTVLKIK